MRDMTGRDRRLDRALAQFRDLNHEVGREIGLARANAGVSQDAAGASVGISGSQFGRIERCELRSVSVEQWRRAAAAVGLRLHVRAYPDGDALRDVPPSSSPGPLPRSAAGRRSASDRSSAPRSNGPASLGCSRRRCWRAGRGRGRDSDPRWSGDVAASSSEEAGRFDDLAHLPPRRRHAREPSCHCRDPRAATAGSPARLQEHPLGVGEGPVPGGGRDRVPVTHLTRGTGQPSAQSTIRPPRGSDIAIAVESVGRRSRSGGSLDV
jgi:helix-turn-helix protein